MSTTSDKGTKENPYSMSEYESLLNSGSWSGGYVKVDNGEVIYIMKEVTVSASCGGSDSGGSFMGSGGGFGSDDHAHGSDFDDFPDIQSPQGPPYPGGDDGMGDEYGPGGGSPGGGGDPGGGGSPGGGGDPGGGGIPGGGNTHTPIPDVSSKVTFSGYTDLDKKGCFNRCKEMLNTAGARVAAQEIAFMHCDSNGLPTNPTIHVQEGINYLNSQLSSGYPVIAIVDHQKGKSVGESWADQAGDHFVLIVGGNSTVGYRYFDPAKRDASYGTSLENVFHYADGKFTSTSSNNVSGHTYTLTSIRKNQ